VKLAALGGRPRLRFLIIAALGIALIYYLLERIGFRAVLSAAASVGWGGFALLCLLAYLLFGLLGPAWHVLIPGNYRLPVRVFIAARMVRDGASETLPFSQVGGMMLGVRAANLLGVPTHLAVASMIVDVTTEMMAQIIYVVAGLLILGLGRHTAHLPLVHSLLQICVVGLLFASLGGGLFLAFQRRGLRWAIGKVTAQILPQSVTHTAGIAAALEEIYRAPLRIVLSVGLHFCAWMGGALSTWIAFRLMGVSISVASVVAIDSIVYAMRSAAFFVPNSLGVQEAAYTTLAPLIGIGKDLGLAVSLIKRARDIAIGIPILLIWQAAEGRRAFAARIAPLDDNTTAGAGVSDPSAP